MTMRVLFLTLLSGLRIQHCCELWNRWQTWLRSLIAMTVAWASGCSSNLTLAWELTYAPGVSLKGKKQKKKKKKKKKKKSKSLAKTRISKPLLSPISLYCPLHYLEQAGLLAHSFLPLTRKGMCSTPHPTSIGPICPQPTSRCIVRLSFPNQQ